MWGLSERVYLQRYANAKKECWFSDKERFNEHDTTEFYQTPVKQRLSRPYFVQVETCTRQVMQGR
jgi:hypothetical protein